MVTNAGKSAVSSRQLCPKRAHRAAQRHRGGLRGARVRCQLSSRDDLRAWPSPTACLALPLFMQDAHDDHILHFAAAINIVAKQPFSLETDFLIAAYCSHVVGENQQFDALQRQHFERRVDEHLDCILPESSCPILRLVNRDPENSTTGLKL